MTMTSPSPPDQAPPPEAVSKAIEAAKAAKRLQDTADTLKAQAATIKDPAERERLFHAAYNKEVEARGQSKKARLMASGWGQGAASGIGLSGAVGVGLGNLVGVLVGGVVAIPGALIGAGVGAVHGPWYSVKGLVVADEHGEGGAEAEEDEKAHGAVVAAVRKSEAEEEKSKPAAFSGAQD